MQCFGDNMSRDRFLIILRCLHFAKNLHPGKTLNFRVYIKNKRHKYGIKLYVLTEPDGLVLNMSVYTGSLDSAGGKGHTKKVVLGLMENHLNCGHSIFMDNFYVSVDLAK
ncbi:hypothetical protein NQ314_018436 [Rhamnusium bicolor]|uniref:PiggyBac transposable element-derived protein domain-containing protein n=1 Tax=Rhamnusium bicolor TaxID=1586634 RepID=A0AAV8WQQ9_9CUCU|nr:hypothetical protein NQ314_018436 [Rhamnusium bicolor]